MSDIDITDTIDQIIYRIKLINYTVESIARPYEEGERIEEAIEDNYWVNSGN